MNRAEQAQQAELFRDKHRGPRLVLLPNAWDASRFAETVERGRAYLAAGADCVHPIGLRDPATIGRLVKALGAPININVRAGSPSVAELEALGVARASTASQVALMAMSLTRQVADDARASGRFDKLAPTMA